MGKIQRAIDWARRAGWLWSFVSTTSLVGLMTVWIASSAKWLSTYGAIAWWFAGLIGALICALIWYLASLGLERYQRWRWIVYSQRASESVNPFDDIFTSKKIDIGVFRNPTAQETIDKKTFINCKLVGPAIVYFTGNTLLNRTSFHHCDFVVVEDDAKIFNGMAFKDLSVQGGSLYFLTILVPRRGVSMIPTGAPWITRI